MSRGASRADTPRTGTSRAGPALLVGGLAAIAARGAYAALSQRPPGGRRTWARTNHRGEPVTLIEGPAAAAAAAAVTLIGPGPPARRRAALAVAGAGAAAFGGYDDLAGRADRRGFRGHLGALAHGEVTSGAVKMAGIGATGLAASALLGGNGPAERSVTDLVVNAGLVAGGANLLNLFDLRPGRAIKVTLAAGAALGAASPAGRMAAAAPVGAALAMLPEDLGERAMLGDAGANALGAMLGAAAATALPRKARVTVLAAIAGLTAASEVVSFTRVIERTPPLRWLDMLGRRPAAQSAEQGRVVTAARIAYVIGTTAGGTGRHAAMLAEGCAARHLRVRVFGPAAARGLFPAVAVTPVDIADRPRPARDAAAVLRLGRLLARYAPDVVHAHGLRAAAFATLALARPPRRRRPALLVTVHNAPPPGAGSGAVYLALERLTALRADAVLCVSADLADRMRRAGARDVALATVPAGPAAAPPGEAVEKARADIAAAGRPVVLAAGRLAPQKGFDVLLEAMITLWDRDPAPLLVIAGEGPMGARLAARAHAAGGDVRFLGWRTDIPALLAVADVVAVPSRWDGQPLLVQEALRAGRPIVASRVGGIPDLTGEDAALLVPPGDPGRLAAAAASVLDDRALGAALGAAALARAEALPSEADAVAAVLAVYSRLAAAVTGLGQGQEADRGGGPEAG